MCHKHCIFSWLLAAALFWAPGCEEKSPSAPASGPSTKQAGEDGEAGGELLLYCGRSESLVEPLIQRFRAESGIQVAVKYGGTSTLAQLLLEEGERSPADLFWAQDAAALGMMAKEGFFVPLPAEVLDRVKQDYRHKEGLWVATSGRARVLAYSPERVSKEELPHSVLDLTDPKWSGRVGWAPTNASFKAFVTAMRLQLGEASTRAWLKAMKRNKTQRYPKNRPILQAIADGQVDLGLPNHYYLYAFKVRDPAFPVEQTFFDDGDIGNLVNLAGVGVLATSSRQEAAARFAAFLLSAESQTFVTEKVYEYPVVEKVDASGNLFDPESLQQRAPNVDLNEIDDLEGTEALLRELEL